MTTNQINHQSTLNPFILFMFKRKQWMVSAAVMAFCLTSPLIATAQQITHQEYYPENAFLIRPLDIGFGLALGYVPVNVEYQHAFNNVVGLSIQPGFVYYGYNNIKAYGAGGTAGPKFSLSGKKLSGWYFYPFVGAVGVSGEDTKDSINVTGGAFTAGTDIGYSWTWDFGLIINLSGGVGYMRWLGDLDNYSTPAVVIPRLNFSLGYSW